MVLDNLNQIELSDPVSLFQKVIDTCEAARLASSKEDKNHLYQEAETFMAPLVNLHLHRRHPLSQKYALITIKL